MPANTDSRAAIIRACFTWERKLLSCRADETDYYTGAFTALQTLRASVGLSAEETTLPGIVPNIHGQRSRWRLRDRGLRVLSDPGSCPLT